MFVMLIMFKDDCGKETAMIVLLRVSLQGET